MSEDVGAEERMGVEFCEKEPDILELWGLVCGREEGVRDLLGCGRGEEKGVCVWPWVVKCV